MPFTRCQSSTLQLAKSPHTIFEISPCFTHLTQWSQTLICQPKGLYSTALLSSFCAPWLIGTFWHCFASSKVVSWQQFYHIGQLHRVFFSQSMLTHFFTTLVQLFGAVSLMACKLVTDEIVLSIGKTVSSKQ